ncbi:MAG: hypothetical protein CMJ78_14265 [Planctomycetaceae bacterium]|nr:hypothetical protein [Planctomycetaceae bacterium]
MESWLAQHFFNSAFVYGGSLLVASPIIIHLINRMRYRRVQFAAMEFLLASQKRNQRRVLIEQLILLLLRILIVLAIVALIARLILDPSQLSVFRGAKAHHFVLLDDSGSMQDRDTAKNVTAFESAMDVVRKVVAEGARRPNSQKLTLLTLSDPEQPLFSQQTINDAFLSDLETKLEGLECSHQSLNLANGLTAALKSLADEKAAVKHLHVVSDFRLRDWQDERAIASLVKQLDSAGVTVNFIKTVGERHRNLAVTGLSGELHVAAAGVPVRLTVKVTNYGEKVEEDVSLAVIQDGQKLPLSIKFDKIEAGLEVQREFDITFDSPKKHTIEVGLVGDPLNEDNVRYLALDVSDVNRVLIIDGDPSAEEAGFLVDALAADPELTGYSPLIEPVDFLRRRPLDEFQSIFMLNVSQLPPDALAPLEQYVSNGGGLAWFLGDVVQPDYYNEHLYKEGKGIFPARLSPTPDELTPPLSDNPGPDLQFGSFSAFSVFEGQENPYIDATRVYKYFPVADDWDLDDQVRKDGVTTVATLRNKQPLIFVHEHGKGRIISCLTSCGPSWNNWAVYASYVVMQLELQKYIARTDRMLERRLVGQPIREVIDPAEFTETVEIRSPDPSGERITRMTASRELSSRSEGSDGENPAPENDEPVRLVSTFRETGAPGIYKIKLLDQNQVPLERWIAYNVPVEESELELAATEQIRKQVGEVRVSIQEPGNFQWIAGRDAGQEIRETLLMLLVILLAAEQLMAYKCSYHSSPA